MSEQLPSDEIVAVERLINYRPRDSQTRIHVVANILRDMLEADDRGEVMLAFTLVMAELAK